MEWHKPHGGPISSLAGRGLRHSKREIQASGQKPGSSLLTPKSPTGDSFKLHSKLDLLKLQLGKTDSISSIWNWVESRSRYQTWVVSGAINQSYDSIYIFQAILPPLWYSATKGWWDLEEGTIELSGKSRVNQESLWLAHILKGLRFT